MISSLRAFLYRFGLRSQPVDLPALTLSVGNISLGGTGKSPFIVLLAEKILAAHRRVAVLSRGYGRKKANLELVLPLQGLPSVEALGDEPWMIKNRLPGISLLVHPDRVKMAKRHWKKMGEPEVVLFDDGFQHWKGLRDFDIVMMDATESLKQRALPFGRFREPLSSLGRADLVVVTRAKSLRGPELDSFKRKIENVLSKRGKVPWKRKSHPSPQVLFADYSFRGFFNLQEEKVTLDPRENYLLVSGVAKPDSVREVVKRNGIFPKEELYFPDHHRLSSGDLETIRKSLGTLGNSKLLITEKDFARWRDQLKGISAFFIRVDLEFLGEGELQFQQFLQETGCFTSV